MYTWCPYACVGIALLTHGTVSADVITIQGSDVPLDTGGFQLVQALDKSGSRYRSQGVFLEMPSLVRYKRYHRDPETEGHVRVEILTFPQSERYGEHNVINVAMEAVSQSGDVGAGALDSEAGSAEPATVIERLIAGHDKLVAYRLSEIEYLRCTLEGNAAGYYLAFVPIDDWPVSGLVAWAAQGEDQMTCLFVKFRSLDGVPLAVISQLLKEHPSSMPSSVPTADEWTREEFAKLRACFASGSDIQAMKRAQASPLLLRDPALLGKDFIWLKAGRNLEEGRDLTPAERTELIDRIVSRIDEAIARYRPTAKE
jgi:hypothetical protein